MKYWTSIEIQIEADGIDSAFQLRDMLAGKLTLEDFVLEAIPFSMEEAQEQ